MKLRCCDQCKKYTLKYICPNCDETVSTRPAHPARFSPADKFSKERIEFKRANGLLPTQLPVEKL